MWQKLASGLGKEESLLESRTNALPSDWTADGKIIYTLAQATGGSPDIDVLPTTGDRKSFAYLATPGLDADAVLSPNGKWMAYQSNESGQLEIFVQSFPAGGGKFQISQTGGFKAMWRRDGEELFFLSLDSNLMSATVEPSDTFVRTTPKAPFPVRTFGVLGIGRQYAAARDGQRILVNVLEQESSKLPITVIVNWLASLQR
jgi:Tol biopolymer transport system component